MATEALTKEEWLEAMRQQGINTLEELADSIFPETGGFEAKLVMPSETRGIEWSFNTHRGPYRMIIDETIPGIA